MTKRNVRPVEKTEKRQLAVQFTDDELQAIGLQLAAQHQEIAKFNGEKKRAADLWKDKIDEATAEAGRLATNRINGYEYRYVDCTTTFDFAKLTRRTVRLDTGEMIEEGPMTEEEQKLAQMALEDARETAAVQP